mmetsp:Transcript_3524/g.7723  ORF Transcript_3524/g.7723 Transcript_3524/m.7723 type:complete len:237 (+) Transcript_3524:393-1103(+)
MISYQIMPHHTMLPSQRTNERTHPPIAVLDVCVCVRVRVSKHGDIRSCPRGFPGSSRRSFAMRRQCLPRRRSIRSCPRGFPAESRRIRRTAIAIAGGRSAGCGCAAPGRRWSGGSCPGRRRRRCCRRYRYRCRCGPPPVPAARASPAWRCRVDRRSCAGASPSGTPRGIRGGRAGRRSCPRPQRGRNKWCRWGHRCRRRRVVRVRVRLLPVARGRCRCRFRRRRCRFRRGRVPVEA